jgi:peptidoglycan/xylan/chitin deacetylase (PgdA/CDA1 family)
MTSAGAPYDFDPIALRPPVRLPGDARVGVFIGLNVEAYDPAGPGPAVVSALTNRPVDPVNAGWRDYGPRVGLWRLSDLLHDLGITPSVLLNSDVCHVNPQIVEHGLQRGWCWVAHGRNNSEWGGGEPPSLGRDDERGYLTEVVDTIAAVVGRRPRGWLGPLGLSHTEHTLGLLAELGLEYCLDWSHDDLPAPLHQPGMISIPYSFEINDLPPFMRTGLSGPDFAGMIVDQFDVLYREGATMPRILPIAVHPFVAGQAFRVRHLDRALRHIIGHDHVWLTTTDAIADWYLDGER